MIGGINFKDRVGFTAGAKIAVASALVAIVAFYFLSSTDVLAERARSSEPLNLTTKSISGLIHLNWDAPTIDVTSVTGYEILRGDIQTTNRLLNLFSIADTISEDTEYVDYNVVPGTEYIYCVRALRDNMKSGLSNCVSVVTTIVPVGATHAIHTPDQNFMLCEITGMLVDRFLMPDMVGKEFATYEDTVETYSSFSFTVNPDCPIPVPIPVAKSSIGPGFNRPKKAATSSVPAQSSTSGSVPVPAPGSAQNQDPDPPPDSSKKPQPDPTPTPKHDSKSSPQALTGEDACYASPNVHYKWISCPRSYWAPGHYPW